MPAPPPDLTPRERLDAILTLALALQQQHRAFLRLGAWLSATAMEGTDAELEALYKTLYAFESQHRTSLAADTEAL